MPSRKRLGSDRLLRKKRKKLLPKLAPWPQDVLRHIGISCHYRLNGKQRHGRATLKDGLEVPFTALVNRYVNLVYSAALRRLKDLSQPKTLPNVKGRGAD